MNETTRCAGCEAGLYLNKYGIHEDYDRPSSYCERVLASAPWTCGCPAPENRRTGPGLCAMCGRFPSRHPEGSP
jgi:hypothetical protein